MLHYYKKIKLNYFFIISIKAAEIANMAKIHPIGYPIIRNRQSTNIRASVISSKLAILAYLYIQSIIAIICNIIHILLFIEWIIYLTIYVIYIDNNKLTMFEMIIITFIFLIIPKLISYLACNIVSIIRFIL